MELRRIGAAALALSSAVLFTAACVTGAEAQKKKVPPKPKPKPANTKALIEEGKKVYLKNACATCHVIGDKGGKIGPDLSHVGKDEKPADLVIYIREPKKKNPNSLMPAYAPNQITDKQLKALVAYLASLK